MKPAPYDIPKLGELTQKWGRQLIGPFGQHDKLGEEAQRWDLVSLVSHKHTPHNIEVSWLT